MKIVTYLVGSKERTGLFLNGNIYNLKDNAGALLNTDLPDDMASFLKSGEKAMETARRVQKAVADEPGKALRAGSSENDLLAPVPHPTSCRDGYAFRQHVEAARRNRKAPMIPEFDQYPIFYFTNHHSIQGPGNIQCMPDHFEKLDFELEVAIVICKPGRNIRAEDADEYIGGLMIMNDMSARRLQMEEMLLNLGPAKGKDFSTVIGPWLVTLEELEAFVVPCKENHVGKSWNLSMKCWVNGVQVSQGNLSDMDWTFAEIIERASYGVDLFPGDVIGSGTVGTGCFLELNGTGKLGDPNYTEQWLQPDDIVDMEIDGLGKLSNTIVAEETDWSILKIKK